MSFERLKFSRAALGITFLKGIAQPAVAMLLALLIGLQSPLYTETVLIVAFSSSPVAVLLASRYRTRETDTASALVATAVLSIVTLPLLMLITT
jgi:predicted permease